MKSHVVNILFFASGLWLIVAGTAWGYGGTIGPNEYVNTPAGRVPTDYKNSLQVPGNPHHYHVTICNDGNWYGVWYPPEWKGNDGRVQATPSNKNQHGYAKEEDGTGGGVQIMGNGKGGDNIDITLRKQNGDTVFLTIHVVNCSQPVPGGGSRGSVAAVVWAEGSRGGLRIPRGGATHLEPAMPSAPQGSEAGEEARHLLLKEAFPEKFGNETKFVPNCSPAKYTTNVNCSMLVANCEKISPEEAKSMGTCLQNKGDNSANIICQLNGQCPRARLLGVMETRNDCPSGGRQWDVDAQWTFECVPNN